MMVLLSSLDLTFYLLNCLLILIAPRISTETKINIDMHLFCMFKYFQYFVCIIFSVTYCVSQTSKSWSQSLLSLMRSVFIKIAGSFQY